jgi:hypothetical protein
MIQEAYSYQVINSPKYYFVYTDKILLGCVEKKSWVRQAVSLEIKNHRYRIERINSKVALITNTTTKELIGKITISGYGLLFSKIVFEYNDIVLKWVSKSIFSLHWCWLKNKEAVIDTIVDFEPGKQKGVIVMSDYFVEADLLIMIGIYLRNNVKLLSFLG